VPNETSFAIVALIRAGSTSESSCCSSGVGVCGVSLWPSSVGGHGGSKQVSEIASMAPIFLLIRE
jgi:hypothetical protein